MQGFTILLTIFLVLGFASLALLEYKIRKARKLRDKLVELARRGPEVFGSSEKFDRWLGSEIQALGGVKPITMIHTVEDVDKLLTILGRIEYGVYS